MQTSLDDRKSTPRSECLALRGSLARGPPRSRAIATSSGRARSFAIAAATSRRRPTRTSPSLVDEPFVRAPSGRHAGLIVELDHIVWRGRPARADAIQLRDGVVAEIARWPIFGGTTWQPGMAPDVLVGAGRAMRQLTGIAIDVVGCTHPAGPPVCWLPQAAARARPRHRAHSRPRFSRRASTSGADRRIAGSRRASGCATSTSLRRRGHDHRLAHETAPRSRPARRPVPARSCPRNSFGRSMTADTSPIIISCAGVRRLTKNPVTVPASHRDHAGGEDPTAATSLRPTGQSAVKIVPSWRR